MTPPWWGIPVVVVVGLAVVWYGWWSDRRRARREAEALRAAPDRPIPGLAPGADPDFTTEDDLPATPAAPGTPSDAAATDLIAHREDAATLPGGTPDPRFFTHPDRGVAALTAPAVLVLDAPLGAQRDVVTLLDAARRRGKALVVVAPEFTTAALGTLRANAVTGRAPNLPVELAEARSLRKAVALTGGRLVPASDLRSDYLPDAAWGTCAGWVSDAENSWVTLEATP